MGLLSNHSSNKFATWTKIIIPGCDGTGFQGNNKGVVEHNGSKLYFRASVNMRASFEWIDIMFGLKKAKKVVFTGSSAGGYAVIAWIDYLKEFVEKPENVYGIIDSGTFCDPRSVWFFFKMFKEFDTIKRSPSHPFLERKKQTSSGIVPRTTK